VGEHRPLNLVAAGREKRRVKSTDNETGVTLVHHWMEYFRGGEAVLEQFGHLFPGAPICILVYNAKHLPPSLLSHPLHASVLQRSHWLRMHFRNLLPVFPEIIRSMRLPRGTRFVLSSDASMIKGIPAAGAVQVCYCHSPPRYLWGHEDSYIDSLGKRSRIGRLMFSAGLPRLREFDRRMAQRVDGFVANSRCVQERIQRYYGRDSVVINPPVDIGRFDWSRPREDFLLVVSALVPYKRVDLAVEACSRLGRRLIVIGTGPEAPELRRSAKPCVEFLGWQPDAVVADHLERCRAFLFPGIEDFGITPCEAQASGAPVIAYGEGGALETVREGVSGLFFTPQTVEGLLEAISRFEGGPPFSAEACRGNVEHLSPPRFRREIREYLVGRYPHIFNGHAWPNP
jgi:glycosyltransferase involved in cell wall biosynthesis